MKIPTEIIFPTKWATEFSATNKIVTYGIFVLSVFLTGLGEFFDDSLPQQNPLKNFIGDKAGESWNLVISATDILYDPSGKVIFGYISYFLYLLILYYFLKGDIKTTFGKFALPFLLLNIFGVIYGIISLIYLNHFLPSYIYYVFAAYILLFNGFLLIRSYRISLVKSTLSVFIPFLFLALFFGIACIAPYLG